MTQPVPRSALSARLSAKHCFDRRLSSRRVFRREKNAHTTAWFCPAQLAANDLPRIGRRHKPERQTGGDDEIKKRRPILVTDHAPPPRGVTLIPSVYQRAVHSLATLTTRLSYFKSAMLDSPGRALARHSKITQRAPAPAECATSSILFVHL
jgi:hypothetical protein